MSPPAIRTGSWLRPKRANRRLRRPLLVIAAAILGAAPAAPIAARTAAAPEFPHSTIERRAPLQFIETQYEPLTFADIPGWADDDHLLAFSAFAASCKSISAQRASAPEQRSLGTSLRGPCNALKHEKIATSVQAREFFEKHFVPVRISRLGEAEGFVTGYYEPIVDGSRTQSDAFPVPVYRRPSNLFVRGFRQANASLPNRGEVFRKIGRRKLVPFYDRGEIEDGALAKRGLELAWLKSPTDLLFMQIQGSARIRFEDGTMLRLNYDAHNGYPYTPVGRVLIERGIVPREEMSMQRIRQWMDDNPEGAKELRRQNRAYVFFRKVELGEDVEPIGAQGIPLTAGRSLAVDKGLHIYGTPFFVEGQLPTEQDGSNAPFRRLMVAQDTGSAIVGPARGDIYFGAGAEAGRLAGRLRHNVRFVMLMPRELDPLGAGKTMPLPMERPSAEIAKLSPEKGADKSAATAGKESEKQNEKANEKAADEKASDEKANNEKPAEKSAENEIPLPASRPDPKQPTPAAKSHPPT